MADENNADSTSTGDGEGQGTASEDNQGGSFFGRGGDQDNSGGDDAQGNANGSGDGNSEGDSESNSAIPEGYFKVPGEGATDDEVAAYRKAVGVPESADGYDMETVPKEFELHDGTKAEYKIPDGLLNVLHEGGAPQSVINAIAKWDVESQQAFVKEQAEKQAEDKTKLENHQKASVKALEGEWGEESKKNWALAERALVVLGGKDFAGKAKELGLADNVDFARFAAAAGQLIGEDTLDTGDGDSKGDNPWAESSFNLTEQGRITRENPDLAKRLKSQAGS